MRKTTKREEIAVSDNQKAFAKFPGDEGQYFLIDIYKIESIGQSTEPTGAIIFAESGKFYRVIVDESLLGQPGGPKDAAEYSLSVLADVALRAAGQHPDQLAMLSNDERAHENYYGDGRDYLERASGPTE